MPRGVAAIAAALLSGCFGPGLPGEIRCAEGLCPGGLVCDDGFCRPRLSSDPDASIDALPADAAVDAAPVCATARFRQGDNGYTGTADTILRQDDPNEILGNLDTVEWDDQNAATGGGRDFGLLRFDGVFGAGVNQVPAGAEIASATLTVVVVEMGTGDPGALRETVPDWSEDTTFSGFGPNFGVQNADLGEIVGDAPTDLGPASFDVAASATRGSAAGAMPGWILVPRSGNPSGVQIASSEEVDGAERPSLEISFCD